MLHIYLVMRHDSLHEWFMRAHQASLGATSEAAAALRLEPRLRPSRATAGCLPRHGVDAARAYRSAELRRRRAVHGAHLTILVNADTLVAALVLERLPDQRLLVRVLQRYLLVGESLESAKASGRGVRVLARVAHLADCRA